MTHERPFRFGVQIGRAESRADWTSKAQRVESLGYDTLLMPDHIGGNLAYAPALVSAAEATSTLRVGIFVLDNDFRHPAIVASEAATIDLLTDGRYEFGLGAGWMLADYERSGIPFDPPKVRVDRFEESLHIIKGLWADGPFSFQGKHYTVKELEGYPKPVQQPHPPIIIGAGGPRMLSIAAREADTLAVIAPALPGGGLDPAGIIASAVAKQVERARQAAGDRFAQIELNALIQALKVTNDRRGEAERLAERFKITADDVLESPNLLTGTVDQITEDLLQRRETYGISYVMIFERNMEEFAPVVARLAGT